MSSWRVAHGARRCGNCHGAIATGEPYLEYRIGTAQRVRCLACGEDMTGEPAPDSIEEPLAPSLDVRHQPSLGLEPIGAVEPVWRRRLRR